MKAVSGVQFIRAILGNHLTRAVLSEFSKYCEVDQKNRLEVALELYVGARSHACARCWLAEKPLAGVLAAGSRAFGVEADDIKRTFRDPYWRKGLVNVIKGIAEFGVRRPFVPGAPFQVVWDVTYACNLRCQHCYASAGRAAKDELGTDDALRLIDKLAVWGVPIIAFSGGEPLVRPDILQLTKHAQEKGIYPAMATNGTLITRERAVELKEAGVQYLQISLDGADAETHDRFRGIEGAFDRTVQGIKNAVDEDFFVTISTTATRANLDQIPRMVEMCDEWGADWLMVYNFIPTGRGKDIRDMDLSPAEREKLLELLYHKNDSSKCQVLTTAPQFARVALQQCQGDSFMVPTHFYNLGVSEGLMGLTEFIGGCGAGRFYVAIRANGNIDPCVFFPHPVGNAVRDDLDALWKSEPLLNDLRNKDILKGNCGSCDYRYHCGGCRARAYGYLGDPLAPDPGCIRNQAVYRSLLEQDGGKERMLSLRRS